MNTRHLVLAGTILALASSNCWAQASDPATAPAADCVPGASTAACPPLLPAADIDGIWAIQGGTAQQLRDAGYFSIRASEQRLLVVIRLGSYEWQAYVTTLAGNSATVVTITGQAINSWRIDFASARRATITGLLCIQNSYGGPLPLAASPSVSSGSTEATTDAAGMPIYLGNRCLVAQGATLALTKVI